MRSRCVRIPIKATAHVPIDRPDTYQRLPTARPQLRRAAGSLIAAPLSRPPVFVFSPGQGSLRGQHELPQHLVRSGKVHNGLTFDHVPTGRPRNCRHPRPGATEVSVKLRVSSVDYAAVAFGAQRNGSPDRQTLCRITDSLRAKATRALPGPERRSIASAQSFGCSGRFAR